MLNLPNKEVNITKGSDVKEPNKALLKNWVIHRTQQNLSDLL